MKENKGAWRVLLGGGQANHVLIYKGTKMAERSLNKGKNKQVAPDTDEHFAFIAGHTSGGFPYGVTWEEYFKDSRHTQEPERHFKALITFRDIKQ